MSQNQWNGLDPARSKLRALAARVEGEIVELGAAAGGTALAADVGDLALAWRELSNAMALGAEPHLRVCPHCRRSVLLEATRCRYCMRPSPAETEPR